MRRLVGLAWFARFGYPYPGNVKAVVKASLGSVPIFGWVLRFSEFVFLARSWAADREQFLAKLAALTTFSESGHPLWLVLYPEGSRLTPEKLSVSQAYAASAGLPVLQHTLLPRLKGFAAMLPVLRAHIDTVYDATVLFEGKTPSMSTVMSGTADTIIHVHLDCYDVNGIPTEEEALHAWLLERWTEKDARIARFKADPKSVGEPLSHLSEKPSVAALYTLFFVFLCTAVPVLYATSRIPNGIQILVGGCSLIVGATALFVMGNLIPSRKGDRSSAEKKIQ